MLSAILERPAKISDVSLVKLNKPSLALLESVLRYFNAPMEECVKEQAATKPVRAQQSVRMVGVCPEDALRILVKWASDA